MTLEALMDWMDALRPCAYTNAQKTAWVNDLEAGLWTEIFLQEPGQWRPRRAERDGAQPLLLPESWRRVYTAYLGAMIDFANGEYTQYENSMSLYNGYLCELGAWYADTFAPAQRPARWMGLGGTDCTGLQADGGQPVGQLPAGGAVLALEGRITQPLDGAGVLTLVSDCRERPLWQRELMADDGGIFRTLSLVLPERGPERVCARFTGEALQAGQIEFWALVQPMREKRGAM
jgi:hypothetical protein